MPTYQVAIEKKHFVPGRMKVDKEIYTIVEFLATCRKEAALRVWAENGVAWLQEMNKWDNRKEERKIDLFVNDPKLGRDIFELPPIVVLA